MSLSATPLLEVAWGKTFADPPVERGVKGSVSTTNRYYASDSAGLSITGDLFIGVDWTPVGSTWRPASTVALAGKWTATGNQRSYLLRQRSDGRTELFWSPDGSSQLSVVASEPPPFTGSQRGCVGVGLDVNDGAGNRVGVIYYSYDGRRWFALETITTAGTTSIFDSSADLHLGYNDGSPTLEAHVDDVFHELWVRSGKDFASGSLVANPHFHDSAVFDADSSGSDAQGNTWTRAGTAGTHEDWTRIDEFARRGFFELGRMRLTDQLEAGQAEFILNNQDRRFEPGYASGPYGTDVQPGTPIRVRLHYDSQARSRWTGFVDKWEADYAIAGEDSLVHLTCTDGFRVLSRLIVSGLEAEIAADDPVGWWKLDERTGTTAVDSGSGGVDGTYTNGPTLGAVGPRGLRAAGFEIGDNSHVVVGDIGVPTSGPWTVEIWAYVDDDSADAQLALIGWDPVSGGGDFGLAINGGSNVNPRRVRIRYPDSPSTIAEKNVVAGDYGTGWHQLVVTGIDQAGSVSLEGYSEGSSPSSTSHNINLPGASAGSFVVVTISKIANVTYTWPAGWTEVQDFGNANGGAAVAFRVFSGAVPSSITVTSSANDAPNYVCAAYSGVDSVEHGSNNGSSGNIDSPSKTAAATPGIWLTVGAGRDTGGPTGVAPAGYTLVKYRQGATLYNAIYQKTGAAATENPAAMTSSGFDAWAAATIALHPSTGETEIAAYVDGAIAATFTDFNSAGSSGNMNVEIAANMTGFGDSFDGFAAQAVVYNKRLGPGRIAAHYAAAIGDLPEEDYAARITRLLTLSNVDLHTVLDPPYVSTLTEFDGEALAPSPLLELLRQAADSEGGAVYIDEEGRLRGRAQNTRATYETTSLWTIGTGVGRRARISLDDDNWYNRVIVGLASTGELVSADNEASIANDGLRVLDLGDLDLEMDDATALAETRLAEFDTPTRRLSGVSVVPERSAAALWPKVRDLQLGQRSTITFAPTIVGSNVVNADFHIERIAVEIGEGWWEEHYELVPAS